MSNYSSCLEWGQCTTAEFFFHQTSFKRVHGLDKTVLEQKLGFPLFFFSAHALWISWAKGCTIHSDWAMSARSHLQGLSLFLEKLHLQRDIDQAFFSRNYSSWKKGLMMPQVNNRHVRRRSLTVLRSHMSSRAAQLEGLTF